ncbi:MAG: LEA type 2 family protein [Treponema sp.]|jgi:LEA14-like dessication related protein|nr:LEA type 2 family protein [Treponema sp.]
MKKKLSLITSVMLCCLIFTACSILKGVMETGLIKAPDVTFKSLDFSNIDFTGLTMLSKISVKNDNFIDIPLPKIDWDLLIDNNPFVNGIIQSAGPLKSQGGTDVEFPVSFTYADLVKVFTTFSDNDAKYKMKMTARIPVPQLGDLSWPFEYEGKLPILRMPNISIAAAPSTSFTYGLIPGVPTGATVSFALNMKNNGNIAVMLSELSYDLKAGASSLSKGGISGKPRIDSGATEKITVNFSLSASEIAQIGINALTGNLKYNLTGNYKLGIPDFPLLNEIGDSFSF